MHLFCAQDAHLAFLLYPRGLHGTATASNQSPPDRLFQGRMDGSVVASDTRHREGAAWCLAIACPLAATLQGFIVVPL